MLVLRLSRTGRKKLANYRLVAADSRRAAQGKFVNQLGHYNPHTKALVFDKEKVEDYIKKGAQPSSAVVRLLKKEKVVLPKWAEANLVIKKKAPKKKEEAPAAPKPVSASAVEPKETAQAETKPDADTQAETKPADTTKPTAQPAEKAAAKPEAAEPAKEEAKKADEKPAAKTTAES
jgi:small subunit ribosomal protein S16